ncbi:Fic family protein [Methanorbis furvi]|uniref:Fido domain-containing protein n=1 Tax=Methanorbis furvi TaxID=3028299 RepID=A0AAE4S9D9_9EURY|nr:hypothetical protein [Methanocorpusculaceae archaeon Ag1]
MAHTDPNTPYNTMPNLPPEAEIETIRIWRACAEAKTSLARMREAGKLIPNQRILISSIPLLEATASSRIENIFTTSNALYTALSVPEEISDPATKEVLRYREALAVGVGELKSGKKLGEILLTRVCSVLLDHEVDRRRAGADTYIKGPEGRVYTPPDDPIILEDLIHHLEEYINGDREPDPLIRLALIHYQFEAIHPFGDANGRTGRILNILYLIDQDLLDIPILYLSRHIIQHKSEYYHRLRQVTENEEWEEWIVFMLNAVRETADWTYDRIQAIKSLMDETIEICKERLPKIYSYDLVEEIFLQPYCKPAFLVDIGIGNRQTAMKYLKALEDTGILASIRIGKERIYVNTRLFELLKFIDE